MDARFKMYIEPVDNPIDIYCNTRLVIDMDYYKYNNVYEYIYDPDKGGYICDHSYRYIREIGLFHLYSFHFYGTDKYIFMDVLKHIKEDVFVLCEIGVVAELLSDELIEFIIDNTQISKFHILYDDDENEVQLEITKLFIYMIMTYEFNTFSILCAQFSFNKPLEVLKYILLNKYNEFIISNEVEQYIKSFLYIKYETSFLELNHNLIKMANDFAQEKIE